MLTRAARQRQNLRHLRHAAKSLQLPWLCPALYTTFTSSAKPPRRPVASRDPKTQPTPRACLSTQSKKLASATPLPDLLTNTSIHNSFSYSQDAPTISQPSMPPLSPQLDISKLLMIDQTTTLPPQRTDNFHSKGGDLRGSSQDVEVTLDACLQLQRWDRALSVLHQLNTLYPLNSSSTRNAYNRFLEAMVFDLIWNRSEENLVRINKWVEGEMLKAGVEPNAHTFALKIKAALATLQGNKRDRTVRRYWDMAQRYNVDWEVASLREILSDNDLGKLSEICPLEIAYNHEPDAEFDTIELSASEDVVSKPAVPQVLEMEQKGWGMSSLRQSLSVLNDPQKLDEWAAVKDTDAKDAHALRRQIQLEEDALQSAIDRWRAENEKMVRMGISSNLQHGKIGSLLWTWHQKLTPDIVDEIAKVEEAEKALKKTPEDKLRCEYGPFLRLVEPRLLAALITLTVMQTMAKAGLDHEHRLATLVTTVGRAVESEVDAMVAKQRLEMKQLEKERRIAQKKGEDAVLAFEGKLRSSKSGPRSGSKLSFCTTNAPFWTTTLHAKIGAILCDLFFKSAKLPRRKEEEEEEAVSEGVASNVHVDAFRRHALFKNGRHTTIVSLHEDIASMLAREPVADVIAKQLPMVSVPRPWTDLHEGGYYKSRSTALRLKNRDKSQGDYAKAAAKRGDLDQLFYGLDILGQTGWRINKDVFSVMLEAWNSGEAIANLPPLNKVFPEIVKPAEDASLKEKYDYRQKMSMIHNEKMGLHSNRCFQNFQMEIAKSYLDETFYLPHNVDFRGRAYPIPPYLNHMGADNARGLLLFEKGRELGPHGLRWLKVHLANVYGYDKASLTDRGKFAMDHMDDIRDSVQSPLTGRRWWLKAEDPWQCLATCQELLRALDSPDPEKYTSHLPVHQDGTCNGLQHYAALGGDIAGARQVNLEPGDKPADVYTGVAELVKADIKADAEGGDKMAQYLDGKITRKIVKQTVMTNVYGVTFNGAMKQVKKQLDEYIPELQQQGRAFAAAIYIARKIFKGLGALFEGAHEIQYWFGDCANRITSSISPAQLDELEALAASGWNGTQTNLRKNSRLRRQMRLIDASSYRSTVVWTTPLKLPVVQPYRVSKADSVQTHIAHFNLVEPTITDGVDRRKQLQAFPPNFIHSLDATHMMLSAMDAHKEGLTFSAVHDSFWTHAADIGRLSDLLREAFIRMHSEDIVGRLAAEFKARYHGHLYLAKVNDGTKLSAEIKKHRKALQTSTENLRSQHPVRRGARLPKINKHKESQCTELVLEHERQKLLRSDDPAERQRGEAMVTAASIFEKYGGEKYLTSKNSLGETALGKVPESAKNPPADTIDEALQHETLAEDHNVDLASTLGPLFEKSEVEHSAQNTQETKPRKTKENGVWLWLPLTFKPLPKKGDWDLQRLRDSTYFFS